jgi:hypothetical protein
MLFKFLDKTEVKLKVSMESLITSFSNFVSNEMQFHKLPGNVFKINDKCYLIHNKNAVKTLINLFTRTSQNFVLPNFVKKTNVFQKTKTFLA